MNNLRSTPYSVSHPATGMFGGLVCTSRLMRMVVIGVVATLGNPFSLLLLFSLPQFSSPAFAQQNAPASLGSETGGMIRQAVATIAPSVVQLRFSGGQVDTSSEITAIGPATGTIVGSEGWIITSSYLLAHNPTTITVELSNGRRAVAERIADDDVFKLSLLKIETTDLTVPSPAPSRQIGQWVIGIGRGYESGFPMVSLGILSAENRIWGKALQVDANVSPLNYGGPLINREGACLGVLLPLSPMADDVSAGVEWYDSGVGFAIAWNDVLNSAEKMKSQKRLKAGRLGLTFKDITEPLAEAIVEQVRSRGPSAMAGIKVKDRIVEANGQPIRRLADLRNQLGRSYADDQLSLTLKRGDETVQTTVTLLDELPPREAGYLGLQLQPAEKNSETVLVRAVVAGSPADQAGLKAGDQILNCDAQPIKTAADLRAILASKTRGETVSLEFKQDQAVLTRELSLVETDWSLTGTLKPWSSEEEPQKNLPDDVIETFDLPEGSDGEAGWAYLPGTAQQATSATFVVLLGRLDRTAQKTLLPLWKTQAITRQIVLFVPPRVDQGKFSTEDLPQLTEAWQKFRTSHPLQIRSLVVIGDESAEPLLWSLVARQQDGIHAVIAPTPELPVTLTDGAGLRELVWLNVASANAAQTTSALKQKRQLQTLKDILKAGVLQVQDEQLDQTKLWNVTSDIARIAEWIDQLNRF